MRYLIIVSFVFLILKKIYSDEYPWETISAVKIELKITKQEIDPLKNEISINCNSDSSYFCQFGNFNMSAFDRDTCFWSELILKSNPVKQDCKYLSCFTPPATTIWITIKIFNKKNNIYRIEITPWSVYEKLELRGKDCWGISLNKILVKDLFERLKDVMNCGQNDLNELINSDVLLPKHIK